MKLRTLTFILIATLSSCAGNIPESKFVKVENGHFIKNGKPYYYIGANFWYGAILASEGLGGDTLRLARELDFLKEAGVENLRVLVGSDGERGVNSKVEPTLQVSPGVYNDTILKGLDRFLAELGKRDMNAVLYLNNSWEWSGGYSQYLQWTGYGKAPLPNIDGFDAYVAYVAQFQQSDSCKALFANYVRDIVSRKNSITGVAYKDDPVIFSWQVGNEPRAFSDENKELFAIWIGDVARLIKSIDSNHMVSTGSEGLYGCEKDTMLLEKIHSYPEIDYINLHIWPYNWGWVTKDSIPQMLDNAIANTEKYIQTHIAVSEKLSKPMVIEEFGLPRDNFLFTPGSPAKSRDTYYKYIFERLLENVRNRGSIAGCNFWAWGGFARTDPANPFWKVGNDYCGDPAQEPQGLNSVFAIDTTTIMLIRDYNKEIKSSVK